VKDWKTSYIKKNKKFKNKRVGKIDKNVANYQIRNIIHNIIPTD
jgi:hypothetical protein